MIRVQAPLGVTSATVPGLAGDRTLVIAPSALKALLDAGWTLVDYTQPVVFEGPLPKSGLPVGAMVYSVMVGSPFWATGDGGMRTGAGRLTQATNGQVRFDMTVNSSVFAALFK